MISEDDRATLKRLTPLLATRKELVEKHGISERFVYREMKIEPVLIASFYTRGLHFFDIDEVREAFKKFTVKKTWREWTTAEVDKMFRWRIEGVPWILIAHRLHRSIDAVESKYKKVYHDKGVL